MSSYTGMTRKRIPKQQEIIVIEEEILDKDGNAIEIVEHQFLLREHAAEKFELYANIVMKISEDERKRINEQVQVTDADLNQPVELAEKVMGTLQSGVRQNLPLLRFLLDKPINPKTEKIDLSLKPTDEWILANVEESVMNEIIVTQEKLNGTESRLKNLQDLLKTVAQQVWAQKLVNELRQSGFDESQIFGQDSALKTLSMTPDLNASTEAKREPSNSTISVGGAD